MIDEAKREAARIGICLVVAGVWLSGFAGWLGTVAAAPFVAGLCMWVWRQES